MSKWEYSVAKNEKELNNGNFEATFETEEKAKEYAETIGEDAIVFEAQYLSEV